MHLILPPNVEKLFIAEPQTGVPNHQFHVLFAAYPLTEDMGWLRCIVSKQIDACRVYQFGTEEERGCMAVFEDHQFTCHKLGVDREHAVAVPCKTRHPVFVFPKDSLKAKPDPGFIHSLDLDIMQLYCAMKGRQLPSPSLSGANRLPAVMRA